MLEHPSRETSALFASALLVAAILVAALLGACRPAQPPPMVAPASGPPPPQAPPPPSFPTRASQGELALSPGFTPQPYVVVGTARGQTPTTHFGAPCPLYVSGPPEYLFTAQGPFEALSVLAQGEGGVGLMLMSEQGGFLCSDPGTSVVRNRMPAGRYAVWIGTTSQGAEAFYRLGFAESEAITPDVLPATLMGAWEAEGEAVSLAPGFAPDPHVVQGQVRGTIEAAGLDASCAGYVGERPTHLVELAADFPLLRFLVRHERDTTLVVTDARGQVFCGDDQEERFPVVEGAFPAGRYRVFVGTKIPGGTSRYSLGFSIDPSRTARSLPRAN